MMPQKKWFQLIQHQCEIAFSSTVNGEHDLYVQYYNKNEESVGEPGDELPELP